MKYKYLLKVAFVNIFILFSLASCVKEEGVVVGEPIKDISGSWKIVKLIRNGEDMSERVDLTNFTLNFEDETYSLTGKMAFAVSEPGSYRLDDPQYPFAVTLIPQGGVEQTLNLEYLIVEGKRQLAFKTSIGCSSNSYEYFFTKE